MDKVFVGRPRAFRTPDELKNLIGEYLEYLHENEGTPFTLTGLAFFIGVNVDTLYEYRSKDDFSDVFAKIYQYAHMQYEQGMLTSARPQGWIFALKNHFKWKDDRNINLNQQITINSVLSSLDSPNKQPEIIEGEVVSAPQEEDFLMLEAPN